MSELTPITRTETFLAKAGGQSVETPTPITREETFLQGVIDAIASGGGGGGGAVAFDFTTLPYLAQTFQSAVSSAVSTGLTSYANQPFNYNTSSEDANVLANYETFLSFLTENDGKVILASFGGGYQPLIYNASTGSAEVVTKGRVSATAYNLDCVFAKKLSGTSLVGVIVQIYGWTTTNVVDE